MSLFLLVDFLLVPSWLSCVVAGVGEIKKWRKNFFFYLRVFEFLFLILFYRSPFLTCSTFKVASHRTLNNTDYRAQHWTRYHAKELYNKIFIFILFQSKIQYNLLFAFYLHISPESSTKKKKFFSVIFFFRFLLPLHAFPSLGCCCCCSSFRVRQAEESRREKKKMETEVVWSHNSP